MGDQRYKPPNLGINPHFSKYTTFPISDLTLGACISGPQRNILLGQCKLIKASIVFSHQKFQHNMATFSGSDKSFKKLCFMQSFQIQKLPFFKKILIIPKNDFGLIFHFLTVLIMLYIGK